MSAEELEFEETQDRLDSIEKDVADIKKQLDAIMAEAEKRGVCLAIPKQGELILGQ